MPPYTPVWQQIVRLDIARVAVIVALPHAPVHCELELRDSLFRRAFDDKEEGVLFFACQVEPGEGHGAGLVRVGFACRLHGQPHPAVDERDILVEACNETAVRLMCVKDHVRAGGPTLSIFVQQLCLLFRHCSVYDELKLERLRGASDGRNSCLEAA